MQTKLGEQYFLTTKPLIKQPLIGSLEENLAELKQEHRYIVEGNYKIIYRVIDNQIYITDILTVDKIQPNRKDTLRHKMPTAICDCKAIAAGFNINL